MSVENIKKRQVLVFTDLDGTLLDHNNYSFAPAQTALDALAARHIPIIPVSSKTASELLAIRRKLDNKHPFITENGASLYIPENYFPMPPDKYCATLVNGSLFWCIKYGEERAHWLAMLDTVNRQGQFRRERDFTHFVHMGIEGIIQTTGLDKTSAAQANSRDATEPIQWLSDVDTKREFTALIQSMGGKLIEGGRFLHLQDPQASKGKAMDLLAKLYCNSAKCTSQAALKPLTIALGDSANDIDMLENSDIAYIIRSHRRPPQLKRTEFTLSKKMGPEGWRECILQFISDHFAN